MLAMGTTRSAVRLLITKQSTRSLIRPIRSLYASQNWRQGACCVQHLYRHRSDYVRRWICANLSLTGNRLLKLTF
jgi:hypothetical protein